MSRPAEESISFLIPPIQPLNEDQLRGQGRNLRAFMYGTTFLRVVKMRPFPDERDKYDTLHEEDEITEGVMW